jgi:hypothetical protein
MVLGNTVTYHAAGTHGNTSGENFETLIWISGPGISNDKTKVN